MEENNTTGMPELVLDPIPSPELKVSGNEMPTVPVSTPEAPSLETGTKSMEESLTPAERKMVDDFASKIDINNSMQILQYGSTAQKKMGSFSEAALNNVRGKDLGDVGGMISNLVVELKNFDPDAEEKKGFMGFFKKQADSMQRLQAKYDTVEHNVDKIVVQLETHKITLLKDITMLDKMYDMNKEYYKELTMYILAGRKRLDHAENVELPELKRIAEESGKPEDAQQANDFAAMCNRFDKKLYDLDLTRNICIQMAPQIRLVQGNDTMMVEKIQSSIVNTIPLWKNQMILSLGLAHSQNAISAQRQVTDITNDLLRKNADMLKTSTIETAKESERGIVDIETLKHTNQSLISTLDEVMNIQQEGRLKRREAQKELEQIENELKGKLLEIRNSADQPITTSTVEVVEPQSSTVLQFDDPTQ